MAQKKAGDVHRKREVPSLGLGVSRGQPEMSGRWLLRDLASQGLGDPKTPSLA